MTYENVFQPLQINSCTVPNRIARTAHGLGGTLSDIVAYHEERARGGAGLTILEIAGVHPSSAYTIPADSDSVLPFYSEISRKIEALGARVFQQLWHGGSAVRRGPQQPMSSSAIPNPLINVIPRPMTRSMIDEMVEAFAAAAGRCKRGGMHGIELHGAHGYLIGQFLSPALNLREDDYGGSRENRVRFLIEILDAVRSEVGSDYPVGVRIVGDDQVGGGIDPPEAAAIARLIESRIDFLDISMSSYWRFHKILSTNDDPLGYEIPTNRDVAASVAVPTIVTGRIMTLDHADRLIGEGVADMVSMVRAMIADPHLVEKSRAGKEAEIRPCIGTNMCVSKLYTGGKMECVVNPDAGREARRVERGSRDTPKTKRVLVVGGGPAGLEAARVAALRGHTVELYELTSALGGQVRMAASAPHRSDLGAITGWLSDEIRRLGVVVRLGTAADPDSIAEREPDDVILATGSTPRRDGFQISSPRSPVPGSGMRHVFTSWDVLGFGGRAAIGPRTVVFDDTGSFEAITVVDKLLSLPTEITVISRIEQIGGNVLFPPATVAASRERIFDSGVNFVPAMALTEIREGEVIAQSLGGTREQSFQADSVVLVTYPQPNDEIASYLEGSSFRVHRVGDINGTSSIQAAIHEAARLEDLL